MAEVSIDWRNFGGRRGILLLALMHPHASTTAMVAHEFRSAAVVPRPSATDPLHRSSSLGVRARRTATRRALISQASLACSLPGLHAICGLALAFMCGPHPVSMDKTCDAHGQSELVRTPSGVDTKGWPTGISRRHAHALPKAIIAMWRASSHGSRESAAPTRRVKGTATLALGSEGWRGVKRGGWGTPR
eukprot:scaffold82785_cov30-Tisochrysis_lutea.AAC.10